MGTLPPEYISFRPHGLRENMETLDPRAGPGMVGMDLCKGPLAIVRVPTRQGKVREFGFSSRSGKSQGIL